MPIGRIERVPLRQVWKKEDKNFTTWLFDNLEVIGEELDMELTPIEKEKSAGTFSADILAEDASGQKVIIENQLEKTDHGHLGQILTYVANLEAKVAIWVSSNPRPEHERAVEWLNEAGTDVAFYLIKIEAYKIGKSEPAAKFTVVTGPSEKTAIVGVEKKELAERHHKRLEFWKTLLERCKDKTKLHADISPSKESWIAMGAGRKGIKYSYVITKKHGQIEIYIDRGKDSEKENKSIFDQLHKNKQSIENEFAGPLKWERLDDRRASRISKRYEASGLNDKDQWEQLQNKMIDGMIRFEKAFKKHIKNLKI